MPPAPQTSVRARRVASELRHLREGADLTCTEVARTLGMSISKVSRMETANCGLPVDDVAAMLGLYRVPMRKRRELLDLLRRSDEKGWWQRQAGLPQLWRNLIDFESKATRIQNFENTLVPGLLQTAEYCRAIIQGFRRELTDDELDHLVATRLARQSLLTRPQAPDLACVIDETALRLSLADPQVMRRQLLHLHAIAQQDNVSLRVVQNSVGAYVGLRGTFMILEFDEDPALVHVEHQTNGLFLDEEGDLQDYRRTWAEILDAALKPGESLELVRHLATET